MASDRSVPLILMVSVKNDDSICKDADGPGNCWCDHHDVVSLCFGEHEVAKITEPDLVWYDGHIDINETVANWLNEKLA
jgi:hypothetical protein